MQSNAIFRPKYPISQTVCNYETGLFLFFYLCTKSRCLRFPSKQNLLTLATDLVREKSTFINGVDCTKHINLHKMILFI